MRILRDLGCLFPRGRLIVGCALAWLAAASLIGPAGAGAEPDPAATVGAQIAACIGREDPACLRQRAQEIASVAGIGLTSRYVQGHAALLEGDFAAASADLAAVATSTVAPAPLRARAAELARIAEASARATAGMERRKVAAGAFEVWFQPGADEVLVGLLDEVLRRAQAPLTAVFGPLPTAPVRIHIYPRVEVLASVTGLSEAQIQTSGTIAVCKYNRLMVTSPRALVFGYAWADTVVHELIHLLVMRRAGANVPIWLHEAIARAHEGVWRGQGPQVLDAMEVEALHAARRSGKFVPFARMSPTMAALPSQEMAQLAFAECHHALAWLLRSYGRPLGELLDVFSAGGDEGAALQQWTGQPRDAVVAQWMAALRRGEGLPAAPPGVQAAALQFRASADRRGRGDRRAAPGQRFSELGDRLLAQGRPAAAVVEYRKAMAQGRGDDLMVNTRLARALVQVGRIDEAAAIAEPASTRAPWHPPLHALRAQIALARSDGRAALAAVWAGVWLNPYDPELLQAGADAARQQGDNAEQQRWRQRLELVR